MKISIVFKALKNLLRGMIPGKKPVETLAKCGLEEELPEIDENRNEPPVYRFSQRSLDNLATCHPDLQSIFHEVIKWVDCSVICGYRGMEEQNRAFRQGKSMLRYPQSNHNFNPSLAIDVIPYPVDWQDIDSFYRLASIVKTIADTKGIKIRWGGDFKNFFDGPHYELV